MTRVVESDEAELDGGNENESISEGWSPMIDIGALDEDSVRPARNQDLPHIPQTPNIQTMRYCLQISLNSLCTA